MIGRFTQQDPLDQIADLRQGNRYLYAGDDPINLVDPAGTFGVFQAAKCAFAIGTAVGGGGRIALLIREFGGIKKAVKALLSADSVAHAAVKLGTTVGLLGGFTGIVTACLE